MDVSLHDPCLHHPKMRWGWEQLKNGIGTSKGCGGAPSRDMSIVTLKISQTCGAIINIDHQSYMYLFQRKVQWCCWGTTPKGAKWILEQYCILDYCPQVRRPWKPSLWGCFFGGGRLQIVRGIDNQNQTLVVKLSQQSTGKKQKKGPSGITFSFPLHSKINFWWCR